MTKPTPIAEIVVVTNVYPSYPNAIQIYCGSRDAEEWVRQNAIEFGCLLYVDVEKMWRLDVNPLFKLSEVVKYLEKMGEN